MTSHLRIAEDEFRAWHSAVAERTGLRGLAAVAKEMEAHLARVGPDQHIVVSRHQLFTWSETLHGAAQRDARGASAGASLSIPQVVQDMRAVLAGRTGMTVSTDVRAPAAPLPPPPPAPPAEPVRHGAVPPVTYLPAGSVPAPSYGGGATVLHGDQIARAVRDLLRDARREVCIVSPWVGGLDTLVNDLAALPRDVRVLSVSRRPDAETAEYHRLMGMLAARRAVTAFSPYLQTRMVIVDGERLLLGAAAAFPPSFPTRETALLVRDAATARAAREVFERAFVEAGGRSAE